MTVIIDGIEYVPKASVQEAMLSPIVALIRSVAFAHGLTAADLTGTRRTARIAAARQLAMWEARHSLGMTFQAIGEAFNRDHGTAIHACKAMAARYATPSAASAASKE
jgi:chromosomal replication initiation ATPase DnaA